MLAYEKVGKGPAVIFIHGYPFRKEMWSKQIAPVANMGFTAIAVDIRGYGESEGVVDTLEGMGDDIIELMDQLKIDKAIIGGMSMGGYITYDLAARYTDRFMGAFFMVTKAAADTEEGKKNRDKLIADVEERGPIAIVDAYLPKLFAPQTYTNNPTIVLKVKEWLLANKVETLIGGLKAMRNRKDRREAISTWQFPTLFIAGEKDALIPVEVMEEDFNRSADGEFKVIKEAGHMANMEEPKEVADILTSWLERNFK